MAAACLSGQNDETLFSFEALVDSVRIGNDEREHVRGLPGELALALRLLDFPTLIIHQPEKRGAGGLAPPSPPPPPPSPPRLDQHPGSGNEPGGGGGGGGGKQGGLSSFNKSHEHAFHKGKSCLFKMHLDTLHALLSSTPLYAMVLDVTGDIPKLVGTSQISLAPLVDKIRLDVNTRGISTPSSHGEKGRVAVFNLMGDQIGSMSVKYKLLSLGTGLLPHILEKRTHVIRSIHEGEHVEVNRREKEKSVGFEQPLHCGQLKASDLRGDNLLGDGQSKQSNQTCDPTRRGDASACVATQTEPTMATRSKAANQPALVESRSFEESLNVFCPPLLFYSSSGEETPASSHGVDEFDDLVDEVGAVAVEAEAAEHQMPDRASAVEHNGNGKRQEDPNGFTQSSHGEALRQLPLLNALLVELSQLTSQSVNQQQPPLSIHPNLAWIYRSTPAEPQAGDGTNPTLNTPRRLARSGLGDCSATHIVPVSKKHQHKNTQICNTSAARTLKYGTTKTFQLRLKRITPGQGKHRRQCMGIESESHVSKGTSDHKHPIIKHDRGKRAVNQMASADANTETVIRSNAGDSATREAGRRWQMNEEDESKHALETFKVELPSDGAQKLAAHLDANTKSIPATRGESTQKWRPLPDRKMEEETEHAGRSSGGGGGDGLWSPPSMHWSAGSSTKGGGGREEDQYMDDFNSLDPSEGLSPPQDPLSSPEPSRANEARKSPASRGGDPGNLDSASDGSRGRRGPVPVVARGSPQRSMRATHIIRPRNRVSALSVSSDSGDDDNKDGEGSVYSSRTSARSRNEPIRKPGRADRSSVNESAGSSRGHHRWSESAQNSGTAADSASASSSASSSSYDSLEVEELRDGIGSLNLKRNYQHISELVANKLPGYTL
ncbi:hypothetical protein CRUP_031743 [Coryphaenoides rupestris]|nr:hypothetical protein CRUP_031743 [Coryphaenoides rupestris]